MTLRPFRVAVFDLDGTLAKTSGLAIGRRAPALVLERVPPGGATTCISFGPEVTVIPSGLIATGIGVAVITRSPRPYASSLLHLLDIDYELLYASDTGDTVAQRLKMVSESFKVEPHEVVYIADTPDDALAAAMAGCQYLHAPWVIGLDHRRWMGPAVPCTHAAHTFIRRGPRDGPPWRDALFAALEHSARTGESLSPADVHSLGEAPITPEMRGSYAWLLLRAAPGQNQRRTLQIWALAEMARRNRQCAIHRDVDQASFEIPPSVITRHEYLDDSGLQTALRGALAGLYPASRIALDSDMPPTYAFAPFHDALGGDVLAQAKNWGGGGKGHSQSEVNIRLLELPACVIASGVGRGQEAIVGAPSTAFAANSPGQASDRLAYRVGLLTGRMVLPALKKNADGLPATPSTGNGREVILIDDQITDGTTVRRSVQALRDANFRVTRVYAWSASNRHRVRPTVLTDSCWLAEAAARLGTVTLCPAQRHHAQASSRRTELADLDRHAA